jgi:hypothetical protein
MAHFAKIINETVTQVIVINNDDCGGGVFPESEPIGQAFIASLLIDGLWLQTSYSGSFRNCFAGISYRFLSNAGEYGEFVPPPIDEP